MEEAARAFGLAGELIVSGDRELLAIIGLSLRVSLTATLLALAIGAPLGAALAVSSFRGRRAVLVFVNGLLGLPPVVVGLLAYLALSRSGPLGFLGLLFSPGGMIVAQFILTLPIIVALVCRACEGPWRRYGGALQLDGAGGGRRLFELLAMARSGLTTAFLTAFGRAISEVGAILVVGGNIRGHTRTMTTAIALETSRGDLALALALGLVLIFLTLTVAAIADVIGRDTVDG